MKPEDVDIRLAVGEPRGESPIKIICPMHRERLGVEDDVGSLAVYRQNIHCFGCGFHLKRRYAALAYLLGEWDGRGSEDGERCQAAVRAVKARLGEYVGGTGEVREGAAFIPPPPDPVMVEAFHQFLLTELEDRLVDALMVERGLSLATIKEYKLGHTGTHFTIPIPNLARGYETIRYRADEHFVDAGEPGFHKYDGQWGRNQPYLYPLPVLHGLDKVDELWVVEGEFDTIASNQAGNITLTVTNGATNVYKLPKLLDDLFPKLLIGQWVIATDQDQAGDRAADKIMDVLSETSRTSIRARWRYGKDLTEFYASGGDRKRMWFE